MTLNKSITYIILSLYLFLMYYLGGFYGAIEFIFALFIYTFIFYFLHFLWVKIRNSQIMYFTDFVQYFLNRISVIMVVITIIIGGLAYTFNEILLAPMPEYTLSDGTKEVKFQAMSHIGTTKFYEQIAKNLTEYKTKGGVYFFEGVKPGKKENLEKFNKAIGINFDDNLYKNFSKLYGVSNQDNSIFIGLVNNLDFNVDLNMDEIVTEYDKKMSAKPEGEREYKSKLPIDANKTIIDSLAGLNERQLKLLVYVNQAILNFIIGSDSTQGFLTDNFTNKDLFDVILGKRNEVLSQEIIKSKYDKIYITYGLLHFKGVFELLKQNDPKWHIVSEKNLYPIKN